MWSRFGFERAGLTRPSGARARFQQKSTTRANPSPAAILTKTFWWFERRRLGFERAGVPPVGGGVEHCFIDVILYIYSII